MIRLVVTDAATLIGDGVTMDCFSEFADLTIYDDIPPEQLARCIGDADGILCNKTPIPAEIFRSCPNLRLICECAAGYNNIDIAAAKQYGVTVCNAGAYSTDAVAQHTFALILHQFSRVAQLNAAVQQGAWKQSKTFAILHTSMEELAGKKLAVIGYGRIGRKVAAIGAAFGMELLVAARTKPTDCPYRLVTIDEAFREGDIVTLHTPLNESTAGMVHRHRLETMKPTAMLVNTARGGLVVEEDLAWALQNGVLACAAVDVLREEPMRETPLEGLPNCIITPHAAWTPKETRRRLLSIAEQNVRLWLEGRPQNVVCEGERTT